MDDQKLKELIQELESQNNEEGAYFGIQQYGGGPDESFIQGNKEGLIRFAKELLKASIKTEKTDGKVVHFFDDDEWMDDMSEVGVNYIEKVDNPNAFLKNRPYYSTNENVIGIGCLILFVGIIILTIVGIATVLRWL